MDVNNIIDKLSANEKKLLLLLDKLKGEATIEEILKSGEFKQQVEIMNASSWLQSKKLVEVKEFTKTLYSLDKEGLQFLKKGLPEKKVLSFLLKNQGYATLDEIGKKNIINSKELPIAIGWLRKKGWADILKEEGKVIIRLTDKGKKTVEIKDEDEKILEHLYENPDSEVEENRIKNLKSRKNVIKSKTTKTYIIKLTEAGKKIAKKGVKFEEEISQITSRIIKEGSWKKAKIRPYDIHAFVPSIYGGKQHPLTFLIEKIRKIFLSMGFEEIEGNFVESCFWNMDVLFIPQDHPARDMQDTLYCEKPSKIRIEDKKILEKIANIHENGGNTGSIGWRYKFSREECEKVLLRTHTTVNTIRYLYENPEPPSKVFSIGRVFRRENLDSTHLPEFYQIEGIVHERGANFRQLIGLLKEFYRRMGFEKIRFRPAYFPYTEPSMEVEVFWNGKWMELGGSGIFRPEVTLPAGVKEPVLAWGLGLERLAMLKFGLKDIRNLYIADLEWLKNVSFKI